MAGIGFELKKLIDRNDLIGAAYAYMSAGLAAVGPWIFTIMALFGITLVYADSLNHTTLIHFRVILVYNLAASLVLSAPVFMVVTRYIADQFYHRNVTNVPSVMLGCLFMLALIQLPVGLFFYCHVFDLPLSLQLSAIANLFLFSAVWLLAVFLSALKDFHSINWAYGVGMAVAFFAAHMLRGDYGAPGMLNGFNIGLTVIVFWLMARVFSEYPYRFDAPFKLLPAFRPYWQLAVGGVVYNMAIWVDKLIMWFAPERVELHSGMIFYPDYDSGMFLAYVTIVPAMALFLFGAETHFFTRYRRFYDDIRNHKPLSQIKENAQALMGSVIYYARNFLVIQGTITFAAIIFAADIIALVDFSYRQIGIFRLGVLGGMLHVLALFQMIILAYFDSRLRVMWLQVFFLASNVLFTLATMHEGLMGFLGLELGFPYYGYGYFLSSALTFLLTSFVLYRFLDNLPYHAFVTHNNAVNHAQAMEQQS